MLAALAMLAGACASGPELLEVVVHNPLPVTRPHELVAFPLARLHEEFSDFAVERLAVLRGREALAVQVADLDLDGQPDSLVALLPLHPGEAALLELQSGEAVAPVAAPCTVQVERDPMLLRRLDPSRLVDARLPVPVVAGIVRADGEVPTPLFPPGSPVRVLEPGPLWASVEIQGRDGARLRVAVAAGSPRVFLHFLPGPGLGRAILVPGSREGASSVEVQAPDRPGGVAAFGVYGPELAAAVLYRPEDAEADPARGQLRFRLATVGREWRCELVLPWDGDPQPRAESAVNFGRELEKLAELATLPPIVRWE